jgi:hypothetical protein
MGGEFWGTFIGAGVGVVAGAFVQYFAQRLYVRGDRKSLLQALQREIQFDETVIDSLIGEVANLKSAIGANSLATYYGYFRVTDVFFIMAQKCMAETLLYGALSGPDLTKLQQAAAFFTPGTQQYISGKIDEFKQGADDPLAFANFLDGEFKHHKQGLHDVNRSLKRVRVSIWSGPKPG